MRELHKKPLPPAALLLSALASCTPASFPLKITDLSATPDPIVGTVVEVSVEVESSRDEKDVTILIQLPDAIQLIDGELTWSGSLRAGEPFTHKVHLRTLYEGDWRIDVTAFSRFGPDDTYGDYETIHFISTKQSGQAVPSLSYGLTTPSLIGLEIAVLIASATAVVAGWRRLSAGRRGSGIALLVAGVVLLILVAPLCGLLWGVNPWG